jgi:HD-GYP domain-containing protein (c-di-GMP phosphodiesterase class II)
MDYSPIRIATIKPDSELPFDLHIQFKDQFIIYAKTKSQFEIEKLKKLKKQKVAKFFIDAKDENAYQDYLDKMLSAAIKDTTMASSEKAAMVDGASKNALEQMRKDPGSEQAYKKSQKATKGIIDVIRSDPGVLKNFFNAESDQDATLSSAVNASALAIRLATVLSVPEEKIEALATGCLLRDVGIVKMAPEYHALFIKPIKSFSAEEFKAYKQHPLLAADLLRDKPFVSKEVLQIIEAHEEKISGEGFPNKLMKLTKEQEIVSLCSAYDRRVTCLKIPPGEAMKELNIDEMGNYNLEMINQLKKLLKADKVI